MRSSLQISLARERAPAAPNGSIFLIGESVLSVELEFVDFEVSQHFDQMLQRFSLGTRPREMSSITPRLGKSG